MLLSCTIRLDPSKRLNNVSDELAGVGTLEQLEPSLGDILEGSRNDGLVGIANLDLAGNGSISDLLDHLGPAGTSIKDDETLDGKSVGDDLEPVLEARGSAVVVLGDGTASRDTTETLDTGEHQVQDLGADVVEVDLDVAFGLLDQLLLEVGIAVVDADVGAQGLDPSALVCGTGDTDDTLATNDLLGDLDDHAAGCAGGSGDNDSVVLGDVDVLETVVGGDTGQAKGAEEVSLLDAGDGVDTGDVGSAEGGVDDGVFAPVGQAVDEGALGEVGGLGLEDGSNTEGGHGSVDLDGREVHAVAVSC